MNKKIIILMMILIFINLTSATDVLIQSFEDETFNIISITPITNNNFYLSYYNNYKEETDYILRFKNDNDVLEFNPDNKIFTILNYDTISDFDSLEIIKNNEVVSEHKLDFCNNNGVCEPCLIPDCETQENELVCEDCKESSEDNFCNIKQDNICDPDCKTYEYEEESVYEECYEDQLVLLTCDDYFGKTCNQEQVCNGTQLLLESSGEMCCLGECEYSEDIYMLDKTCNDFFWDSCESNEVCGGEEFYFEHNGQTCCNVECEPSEIDDPVVPEQPKDYTEIIIISLLIIAVVLLIIVIAKKKVIKISIFIFLIASSAILFTTYSGKNQITGNVIAPQEQAKMVCEIAEAYNLPSSYLLAIAYKESGVNHYNSEGSVKITLDGGVGMMQVTRSGGVPDGPFYACGYSAIDGRKLDAKQLKDNIECGAIELIGKCNTFSCINNQKQYYCANEDNLNQPKNVIYSDWDIAVRGYNGWGCNAPAYRDLYGGMSVKYRDLIYRVQNYVEDFRQVEKQFQGYCDTYQLNTDTGSDDPADATNPVTSIETETGETKTIVPEEITSGEKIGFYYLNPSFTIQTYGLGEAYDEMSFSPVLIKETLECKNDETTYDFCIRKVFETHEKTNWNLDGVNENKAIAMFSVDTKVNFNPSSISLAEKPLILKFALTITEKGTEAFPDFKYDEVVYTVESSDEEPSDEDKPYDEPEKISEGCLDKDLSIVLFGDSITQGHYNYGNYLQAYFNGNFDKKVDVFITQGLGGLRVDNQASKEMFTNEIIPRNPDFVLMWFGMNSLENYPTVHQDTYQEMIEIMLSKGITPILLTTSPTCSAYTSRDFSYLDTIVQMDKNLATYYDGVYLIDVRDELNKAIGDNCAEYFADGYHLNKKGHDLFAQIVVKQFIEWKNAGPGPFICQ